MSFTDLLFGGSGRRKPFPTGNGGSYGRKSSGKRSTGSGSGSTSYASGFKDALKMVQSAAKGSTGRKSGGYRRRSR